MTASNDSTLGVDEHRTSVSTSGAGDRRARLAASKQERQNNTELTEKDKATECTEKREFWRFAQARYKTWCAVQQFSCLREAHKIVLRALRGFIFLRELRVVLPCSLACGQSAPTRSAAALNFATATDSLIPGSYHSCRTLELNAPHGAALLCRRHRGAGHGADQSAQIGVMSRHGSTPCSRRKYRNDDTPGLTPGPGGQLIGGPGTRTRHLLNTPAASRSTNQA
jgi:hypothetical protein